MPPSVAILQETNSFKELLKFPEQASVSKPTPTVRVQLTAAQQSETPAPAASCHRRRHNHQYKQPAITLNDGNKIPLLGLGTWNAQGKELKQAVKSAIYAGYRHIDTAANYKNEFIVGEAIAECIKEGIVTREDLYITTKLWNNSHTRSSVPRALNASLKKLNLAYVDLYLIHYPIGYKEGHELSPVDEFGVLQTSDVDYIETWLGMQDTKHLGLTRSIGVSNFNKAQLNRIIRYCTIVPAMNQVECHPYLNQSTMLDFCRKHRIALTAYSPLGSPGKLPVSSTNNNGSCNGGTPTTILKKHQQPLFLLEDSIVKQIAEKHQVSASQVLIRYQMQRNIVVIPKAIQAAHIESNLGALSTNLSEEDMQILDSLNCNHRFMLFERCINHKFYPFNDDC